jgi:hypothetical protein
MIAAKKLTTERPNLTTDYTDQGINTDSNQGKTKLFQIAAGIKLRRIV